MYFSPETSPTVVTGHSFCSLTSLDFSSLAIAVGEVQDSPEQRAQSFAISEGHCCTFPNAWEWASKGDMQTAFSIFRSYWCKDLIVDFHDFCTFL